MSTPPDVLRRALAAWVRQFQEQARHGDDAFVDFRGVDPEQWAEGAALYLHELIERERPKKFHDLAGELPPDGAVDVTTLTDTHHKYWDPATGTLFVGGPLALHK
jgi:hypothetical protein